LDKANTTIRRKPPSKLTVKSYYYSFENEEGELRHDVENFISLIEGKSDPVIGKLTRDQDPAHLTPEERVYTSIYLSMMLQRTPSFLDHLNHELSKVPRMVGLVGASNKAFFHETMQRLIEAGEIDADVDVEEVRQFAISGEYDVSMTNPAILDHFVRLSQDIAKIIVKMNWRVLRTSSGDRFITSDAPFSMISTKPELLIMGGVGWLSPYMEAFLPLSPKTGILLSFHHPEGIEVARSSQVLEANARTVAIAARQVFASDPKDFSHLRNRPSGPWAPLSDALVPDQGTAQDNGESNKAT
jgi:hypothetical protein